MRNDILGASEEMEVSDEELIEVSKEYDQPLKIPEITLEKGALKLLKKLLDYSDWQGNEELSKAITRIKNVLIDLQLKSMNSMK